MKYEKPQVEVMQFDYADFITASGNGGPCNGYTDSVGHTCGAYSNGNCSSWTSPSFGGSTCSSYDGHKCHGYSDNRHSNCAEYGISCATF